jgi:hypothetical protein
MRERGATGAARRDCQTRTPHYELTHLAKEAIVADARLNAYLILLAPALARIDGVTDDPADVEMAEAILVAAESADGVGLTRSEIAARAGVDADDQRFNARLDLLARTGALRHLRGDKKHQIRYLPDPVALLAAEILTRLGQDHGAEELHSMLVAAADRLEATFHDDPGGRHVPSVPEVAALIGKLSALLHAYALRMETAVIAGTYEELVRARTGSSTIRQMTQIERICRAVNRAASPYSGLFHESNQLLAAGQRFVTAAEKLTGRLVEVARRADSGILGLADYDTYRDAAIHRSLQQLADVAATVPLQATPPIVHLADLAAAAAGLDLAPRERTLPEPPRPDPASDPRIALAERRDRANARKQARRDWALRLLADAGEIDVTSHATTWPHAARLLGDLIALSRDPAVPVAADVGDPPLIEPAAEVYLQHPLRARRVDHAGQASGSVPGQRRAGELQAERLAVT